MQTQTTGTALVDHLSRPLENSSVRKSDEAIPSLHPLDDPAEWLRSPAYDAPKEIDIAREQAAIDRIYGTTRDNQSIMKLVWAGDREYWDQYFTEWNGLGQPTKEPERWPLIRYGTIRDEFNRPVRHTFPPRWLILTRIEKEQYAATWGVESWVRAPEINGFKLVRPPEPPPVFWMWFATVAYHSGHCCGTARKNRKHCYGKYAPPSHIHETLGIQAKADRQSGHRPFEAVTFDTIGDILNDNNGYRAELNELKASTDIFVENPMALIGILGGQKAGIDTPKKARQIVSDFVKRQAERLAKKA